MTKPVIDVSKPDPEKIYSALRREYPGANISLSYTNPLELLIAVMLSAQCTDKMVNIVTGTLFKRYRTVEEYAGCDIDELKRIIFSAGFYNAKAKHIKKTCGIIVERFGGNVPETMEDLLTLPGVARKTANIVLSNAFDKNEGIAVDTHVKRITFRLGLTTSKDPYYIEKDLMKILPKELWNKFTYVLIEHGRNACRSQNPMCSRCVLEKVCPKIGVTTNS